MLTILDLSNNNHDPISFSAIRSHGAYGVWLKVTEGDAFTDATWQDRSKRARASGLHVGGYHFARPSAGTAVAQASRFVAELGKIGRRDLRPVLDLEANDAKLSAAALWEWCHHFCERVHQFSGSYCIVYSSPSFIGAQHWSQAFGKYQWLAEYGPDDGNDHGATVIPPWKVLAAHQYTSVGRWPGVTGNVDLSHAPSRRRVLAHPLAGLP